MSDLSQAFDALSAVDLRRRGTLKWTAHPEDVLPMWIAEMDFPTAQPIVAALRDAVDRQEFGYAARMESTDLPEAVADWCFERYGWEFDPARVHLMADVVRSIEVAIEAFSPEGSPIVVTTPAYAPFFGVAQNLNRPVVAVPLAGTGVGAALDLPAIEAAFVGGAKTLILCHPYNPVGRVFTREELAALSLVVEAHGARVVSDEIHAQLVYADRSHVPYATVSPAAAEHTITLVSATKAWNLAGLNCAQVICSNEADQRQWQELSMMKTHGASSLGIRASIAAYRSGGPWLDEVVGYLDKNRHLLADLVAEQLPGVRYVEPEATYFGWLDFTDLELDVEPADFFLEHARVALSSGVSFGPNGRGHARMNFATSRSFVEQAVTSMAAALARR